MTREVFCLKGKRILVLGATGGIGSSCARLLSESGARVLLQGRNSEELETLSEVIGPSAESVEGDFCKVEDRKRICGKVREQGGIDGLVHSVGFLDLVPARFLLDEKLHRTMEVNFSSISAIIRELLTDRSIRAEASILFISSIITRIAAPGHAAYAASKGAMESFARILALELAPKKIRVNCLLPAMVRTGMAAQSEDKVSSASFSEHASQYPLGIGEPEDVAAFVAFLLSDSAKWLTGQSYVADGGLSLRAGV